MSANPAAPAESIEAPGAAAPQAASPDKEATPSPEDAAPLSTAVLGERIRSALLGEPKTKEPEEVPGQASPPEADPGSSTEEVAPESPETPEAGLSREALAALAEERSRKRQLKEKLAEKDAELVSLRERLEKLEERAAAAAKVEPPPVASPPGPTIDGLPVPPAVAEAERKEQNQRELLNWSRQRSRELRRAVETGETGPVINGILTDLRHASIELPGHDSDTVLLWLEQAEQQARDGLDDARIEARVLKQRAREQIEATRRESEALAKEWAPQLAEADSKQAKKAAQIRQFFPLLERHPLGPRFIAAAVRGWDVIDAELDGKALAAPPAGKPSSNGTTKPPPEPPARGARLPGAATAMPARPQEGEQSSSSLFARMNAATTEAERERLKTQWVKAALSGQ